ncbi:MAG: shikimate dehydrogenase [Pseudomonadota bacterium]
MRPQRLKIGLIGAHLGRSRFGAALRRMAEPQGIALDFALLDTAGDPTPFVQHLDTAHAAGFRGLAVTHPFKLDAWAQASHRPRHPRASNLLIFGSGITAYNTDRAGFVAAWRARFGDRAPGLVAMAGAGGVALALTAALRDLGAERIRVWDPVPGRAQAFAQLPGAEPVDVTEMADAMRAADGLVNASPLGQFHIGGTAFPPALIGGQSWAFDAVYTPVETPFIGASRARGLAVLTGFDLFRHMAAESFRHLTGCPADPESLRDLLPVP